MKGLEDYVFALILSIAIAFGILSVALYASTSFMDQLGFIAMEHSYRTAGIACGGFSLLCWFSLIWPQWRKRRSANVQRVISRAPRWWVK